MEIKKIYTVTIGENSTRIKHPHKEVILDSDTGETGDVSEYEGRRHNYDGLEGWLIDRAVKKLFGIKAFWFGEHGMINRGQVFRPMKNNDANTSLTNRVMVEIN